MESPFVVILLYAVFQSAVHVASALIRTKVGSRGKTAESASESQISPLRASFSVCVFDFDSFQVPSKVSSLKALNLATEGGIFGKPICTGSREFVSDESNAPTDFCRYDNGQLNMTLALSVPGKSVDFDEFALERVLLGKWVELENKQLADAKGQRCDKADVVVVPSLGFHNLLSHGVKWPSVSGAMPNAQQSYWEILRKKLYQPSRNYTPVVVVHQPYTFVKDQSVDLLRTLLEQPAGFINQVVIGAIESNLRPAVRDRIHMPEDWHDNADAEIERRLAHSLKKSENPGGSPLIVSLPYPTPILHPRSFLADRGAYRSTTARKIGILMMASLKKGHGSNWIRPLIHQTMKRRSGTDNGIVCSHTSGNPSKFCGATTAKPNMWELLVNSAFCIEPAGDTLTRSHFYLAILTGCVPVLIDGGHDLYSESARTAWAWRRATSTSFDKRPSPFIDYSEFAVIYSAAEFKARKDSIIQELLDMPSKEPQRFLALRQGVERVAPRMRYAGKGCGTDCDDAFAAFASVVSTQVRANKRA